MLKKQRLIIQEYGGEKLTDIIVIELMKMDHIHEVHYGRTDKG